MISGGTEQRARKIRRATAATAVASACLVALVRVDRLLDTTASGQVLRMTTDLAVGLLVLLLAPAIVRILAHPGDAALPARSGTRTLTGLTGALGCLLIGFTATMAGRLLGGASAQEPVVGRVLMITLASLTATATAAAAAQLSAARAGDHDQCATAPTRPDLVDDLALLSARALPGSPVARALAGCNRGLDRWAWSPRHRIGTPRQAGAPSARSG